MSHYLYLFEMSIKDKSNIHRKQAELTILPNKKSWDQRSMDRSCYRTKVGLPPKTPGPMSDENRNL